MSRTGLAANQLYVSSVSVVELLQLYRSCLLTVNVKIIPRRN